MLSLEVIWYLVICAAVVAFVVLDGFDLGVGMLHLFAKTDEDRRVMLNSIGPVWDGNEVWLIVVGGALLAGFPVAYATLCSAFYIPFMIFLAGIIFRAVAIEFRSKLPSKRWRTSWDIAYCLATYVITIILGVLLGNLIRGIPLEDYGVFVGDFSSYFSPYTVLTGITAVALFMMHGALFLAMKTEGAFHDKVRSWSISCMIFFIIAYVCLTVATITFMPHMMDRMRDMPLLFIVAVAAMLFIADIPRRIKKNQCGFAFLSSIISIALLISLFGIGTFPVIIRSTIETATNSITIFNSSSSDITLKVLFVIAGIGLPLVIAYGWWIYHIFRGKVKLDSTSY